MTRDEVEPPNGSVPLLSRSEGRAAAEAIGKKLELLAGDHRLSPEEPRQRAELSAALLDLWSSKHPLGSTQLDPESFIVQTLHIASQLAAHEQFLQKHQPSEVSERSDTSAFRDAAWIGLSSAPDSEVRRAFETNTEAIRQMHPPRPILNLIPGFARRRFEAHAPHAQQAAVAQREACLAFLAGH